MRLSTLFPEIVTGAPIPNALRTMEELECARCTDLPTLSDAALMGEENMMRRLHAVTRNQRCRVVVPDAGPTGSLLVSEWALWRLKKIRAEIDSHRSRRSA